MDFGVIGYDELVGSDTTGFTSDPVMKQKWYGSSGFQKQERSGNINIEDDWRSPKVAKTGHHNNHDGGGSGDAMLLPQQRNSNNSSLRRSNTISFDHGQHHQNMLSFSSPKSDVVSVEKGSENPALPYYHLTSPAYTRTAGYNCGRMSVGGSMHGVLLASGRGAFTPSQWMELEHQALIYKYINSNVPIPPNLLIPIRKALESAAFSGFSAGLLRPNTLGWGPFHLGFSGSTDPEPGRCRRTDGKKWRCSRDAVADQKYCERHMNRGRHRSRKPVEGQSGHSVAATSTTTTTTTSKLNTTTTTSSSSVVVMTPTGGSGGSAASGNLTAADQQRRQQQLKNLHHPSGAPINRMSLSGDNLEDGKQEGLFVMSKQQYPFAESSHSEFGLVSSDSLLNPSQNPSLLSCRKFGSSQSLTNQEIGESQHSVRQFMDEWPKIDMQSDRTQLSISIPATSPPNNNEKLTLSPLRLSHDFDPIQMGLGVGSVLSEQNQRQANWIPISWESSMGGPLGEVLKNTNNNNSSNNRRVMECKNSSALNLMTEGWDNSPRLSPTGVLQKTAFGSLSNSSAGSSPRAENNKTSEGASLCNDLLG